MCVCVYIYIFIYETICIYNPVYAFQCIKPVNSVERSNPYWVRFFLPLGNWSMTKEMTKPAMAKVYF